jgi:Mce-associated membrane protein
VTSDESRDSTDPSQDAQSVPFQFSNQASTTATLPKDDPTAADVEHVADVEDDADVAAASTDPDEPQESGDAAAKVSVVRRLTRVGAPTWVFLAVAMVALVMSFTSWRTANNDPDRDRADLRDNALIQGTADVETMTSMDHRDVAAGIKAWQSVSTGVLHDQLTSVGQDEQKMLADQGKIATGRVVDAALTDLTDRTATLITAVEVTVREDDASKEPAVKRNRFSADLVLVDGRWKIENLQQVAVGV